MYKCSCGKIHTNREWDDATRADYRKRYGDADILPIGDPDMTGAEYICPSCGKNTDGFDLKKVTRRPKEDGRDTDNHG